MNRFHALEISYQVIRSLRDVVPEIRRGRGRLADQIEDAASSIALNLAEGRRRTGKDRLHLYRVAAGSADEVRTALRVAQAWGYVGERELAILWTLTQGRKAHPC